MDTVMYVIALAVFSGGAWGGIYWYREGFTQIAATVWVAALLSGVTSFALGHIIGLLDELKERASKLDSKDHSAAQ